MIMIKWTQIVALSVIIGAVFALAHEDVVYEPSRAYLEAASRHKRQADPDVPDYEKIGEIQDYGNNTHYCNGNLLDDGPPGMVREFLPGWPDVDDWANGSGSLGRGAWAWKCCCMNAIFPCPYGWCKRGAATPCHCRTCPDVKEDKVCSNKGKEYRSPCDFKYWACHNGRRGHWLVGKPTATKRCKQIADENNFNIPITLCNHGNRDIV
ncbi:hypothetical protein GZH46_02533 [Fragariocoptes setiger]|uniref:Kazal-like domain-containing protein n=1 Tax=Fragariocoptes setiger TaxID=1670756 RepID=A0ABQ7S6C2_9ACAR|nr:hypothetical protein GZH46_02533 [Fragariocoptes setiger]